jgi:hypothetical protein
MNSEDALNFLISYLRRPISTGYSSYGYHLYLPHVIVAYIWSQENKSCDVNNPRVRELSPNFYAAAWELCRRGVIRPGVHTLGEQATSDGSAGNGYSITPFGETWLKEFDRDDFVPTEPGRFASMLKPYHDRFGSAFYERAQEAIRCYGAHAYLACCTMCGAASESILLATAIAKTSEEKVLKAYASTMGRSRVEKMLLGQSREQIQREFGGFTTLLKYWRDQAAHGKASGIADNEAYTSLAMLLRFAQFVNDNWDELTGN